MLGEFQDRSIEERVHLIGAEEPRETTLKLRQLDILDGCNGHDTAPDKKLVKGAERGEAEADRSAGDLFAGEIAKVGAEVVSVEIGPGRSGSAFLAMPAGELFECLAIIALGVGAGGAIGGKVNEERFGMRVKPGCRSTRGSGWHGSHKGCAGHDGRWQRGGCKPRRF